MAPVAEQDQIVLRVEGLRLATTAGVEIVDEVTFQLTRGEILGLVGESGCGKTSTALAILGYVRPGMRVDSGSVTLDGVSVLSRGEDDLAELRGRRVAYVPQDPSTALNPRRRISTQMEEVLTIHRTPQAGAKAFARELVERVGISEPDRILASYPFELSGGQQQRILIAMALAGQPSVVVLDEPTTGLDVTTQARILELIRELSAASQSAFVYVTHDLAVVEAIADRIAVMYSGRVVELGPTREVLSDPAHPYTGLLLESVPRIRTRRKLRGVPGRLSSPGSRPSGCFFRLRCPIAIESCVARFPPPTEYGGGRLVRCSRAGELEVSGRRIAESAPVGSEAPELDGPLLEVTGLTARYGRAADGPPAVDDVSFQAAPKECVALVGESGSGKTTTGRCITGLHHPEAGEIKLNGEPLAPRAELRSAEQRRSIAIVFQNPDRSLNPSHRIIATVMRPLVLLGGLEGDRRAQAAALLERVHLSKSMLDRYPHELSGGEQQRVAIARALSVAPQLLVCDEVTSALDVSIQAQIINVLQELRADGLAMLFITHNLGIVNSIADRTLVMEAGVICEQGKTLQILREPRDEYTRTLLAAAPELSVGTAG